MKNELDAPSGLVAAARPGVNSVQFSSANSRDVAYEIWRRHGDTVDWYLHATVSDPVLEDTNVTPGQYYEYKVRAALEGEFSGFSDSVVVYGKA